jgi:RNA polymerase sigma-70 factor (family 1)
VTADTHINYLLAEICSNNCEKSYKSLFMLLHERLLRFAGTILGSNEDAEEVVSDFFIAIWQRRKAMAPLEKPLLYFFVGVKHTALNRLKANKKAQLSQTTAWQLQLDSFFFNPEELMLSEEFTQKIMRCINELPPRCRLIFNLVKLDGLKYAETAQLLDVSVKTVEAQMAIALRRLKTCTGFENTFPEIHSLLAPKK